jgi:protein-L-isoaspartate(D-aspartate) O-methyltransferase
MLEVDRKFFTDNNPYEDAPQYIGHNATISAPHMHAYALEVLEEKLVSGANVLDVGSGSGYLAACMAMMVDF